MTNHKHRGIGALTGKGQRRGWASVGRATAAPRPRARVPERCAIRPAHEGAIYRRRPPIAPVPAPPATDDATRPVDRPCFTDLALLMLATLALFVVPLQFAGTLIQ